MKRKWSYWLCMLMISTFFVTVGQTDIRSNQSIHLQSKLESSTNTTRDYWPTNGWRNSTPEAEGMNSTILNDMLEYIDEQEYPIDSILIIKNGYLVFEEYSGYYNVYTRHELHSATKSFTSTLVGIALQQGLIESVNEYVLDFFPEYTLQNPDPRKELMTIEHLLTMSAGLEWNESTLPYLDPEVNDIGGIIYSDDGVQFVLDKPMVHDPGTHWLYSGGVSLLLGAIVQQAAGVSLRSFADEYLFDPLGFDGASWFQVPGGWYNSFGGQFKIRPREMAKLGFLYLNDGEWNGTQILPEDYVHNATQAAFVNIYPEVPGYGWQWWLLPDMETFLAWGRGGQQIIVSREHDLVVVFTASIGDYDYDPEFYLFNEYILGQLQSYNPFANPVIIGATLSIVGVSLIAVVVYWFSKKRFNDSP